MSSKSVYDSRFSTSVNECVERLNAKRIDSNLVELVEEMLALHDDYIRDFVSNRSFTRGILLAQKADSTRFPTEEWKNEILKLVKNEAVTVVAGRLFLICAALYRYSLPFHPQNVKEKIAFQEGMRPFVDALKLELERNPSVILLAVLSQRGTELYEELMMDTRSGSSKSPSVETGNLKEGPASPETSSIETKNLSDSPSETDALSRDALAKYLASRLRYIYDNEISKAPKTSQKPDGKKVGKGPAFFVHIDGSWGSGKSTLMTFLRNALLDDSKDPDSGVNKTPWIIVEFNAWESQRLDPPWWFLMNAVYRKMFSFLRGRNPLRAFRLWVSEGLWRLNTGTNNVWAGLITVLLLAATVYIAVSRNDVNVLNKEWWKELPLASLITFIGFLWSLTKVLRDSLVPGSGKAAQKFVEDNSKDPMNVLATHFSKQIIRAGYPVAVFIDDLDRCNKDYGIKLLEGLQTIFRNAPAVYVVAADRRWLTTMYEQQYSIFAPAIASPGKPFGQTFLDKTFQLIVELPDISIDHKTNYWNSLLGIKNQEAVDNKKSELSKKVENAKNNEEKLALVTESETPEMQFVREEVVRTLKIAQENRKLNHELQEFVKVVASNPRSMKRLINDIGTASAINILYNQRVTQEALMLWCNLKLQYPMLANVFWDSPDKLNILHDRTQTEVTGIASLDELLRSDQVYQMFRFKLEGKEAIIDSEFIRKIKFEKSSVESSEDPSENRASVVA